MAALDAGDVFAEERYEVRGTPPRATCSTPSPRSAPPLLARVVDGIADGSVVAVPQQGEPTLAPKLTLDDGALDFSLDAETLRARIAGGHSRTRRPHDLRRRAPEGAARRGEHGGSDSAGRVVASGREILVGTASSPLRLETVQPAGKGAMPAGDWFRGLRVENPVLGS